MVKKIASSIFVALMDIKFKKNQTYQKDVFVLDSPADKEAAYELDSSADEEAAYKLDSSDED